MKHIRVILVLLPIAIIASIVVSGFQTARNRSQQRQTLITLSAWGEVFDTGARKHPPAVDGWGHPLRITRGAHGGYTIQAAGRDGRFEQTIYPVATTSFDSDIVYADGSYIRFPLGM